MIVEEKLVKIETVRNGYVLEYNQYDENGSGLSSARYVYSSIFELLTAINTFLNPDSSEKRDLIERGLGGIKFAYYNSPMTVPEELHK